MSGFRSILPLILLPVVAGAQEPSGLEKVKQDLKTLPSVRKEPGRTGISLPNIAAPGPATDLSAPMPAPARSRPPADEAKNGGTKENWLVDAMMNDDIRESGTGRKRARAQDRDDPGAPDAAGRHRDSDRDSPHAREPMPSERASDLALAKIGNPLTPFMADWISKRDHALLLPKGTSDLTFGTDNPGAVSGPGSSAVITFRGIDGETAPLTRHAATQPAENPFLQALQAPAGAPPATAPVPALPGAGERPPLLTPPAPAPETRPQPPIDLTKPSDDKKYFPQLKRF